MKKNKIKKKLNNLKKEKGISKKLSKQEENQKLLSVMSQKKSTKVEEEIIEQKQEKKRSYICSCGCQVVLEGETYKRKIKEGFELCSKCSGELL